MTADKEATVDRRVIPSKVLNAALGRVLHAAADDANRPILTCLLFEGDAEGLRVVAADNYRIAIADVDSGDYSAFGRINVPKDQVLILRAFLAKRSRDVTVFHDNEALTASDVDRDSVTLRLMWGSFPNYRSAIVDKPVARSAVHVDQRFLIDSLRALKGATATRIEVPDNELEAIYLKADGYSEFIMPIRVAGEGYEFGSEAEKVAA